jgi:hypothetical protein
MDQTALVAELKKLRNRLAHDQGPLALLMLWAPAGDAFHGWSLIVSAKGLDKKSRAQGIEKLTKELRNTVSKDVWNVIVRATVLPTTDPFVKAVNEAFPVRKEPLRITATNVGGFDIPIGVVLESHAPTAGAA